VVAGLGSILVAFRPLSDDFTSGMLDMSRSFREWAANLGESGGFQRVRRLHPRERPAVRDFFSAMARRWSGSRRRRLRGARCAADPDRRRERLRADRGLADRPALFTAAAGCWRSAASNGLGKMSTSLGLIGVNSEKAQGSRRARRQGRGILLLGQALGALANSLNTGNAIKERPCPRHREHHERPLDVSLKKLSESLEDVNERGAGTVNALFAIPSA
jgi:hypothetical protein